MKDYDNGCSDSKGVFEEPLDVKQKIQILRKGEVELSHESVIKVTTPTRFILNPLSLLGTSPSTQSDTSSDSVNTPSSPSGDSNQIRLYLISQPITYLGCSWTEDEKLVSSPSSKKPFTRSQSMIFTSNNYSDDFIMIDKFNSPLHTDPNSKDSPLIFQPSSLSSISLPNSVPKLMSPVEEQFASDNIELPPGETEAFFMRRNLQNPKTPISGSPQPSTSNKINELIQSHNIDSNRLFGNKGEPTETTSAFSPEKKDYKFDFKAFLQKLKDKSVVQLTRKIKAFTFEISKKDYTRETPEITQNFISEIMHEISNHEQWKNATEQDLMNAREGIEKYVMTKIYNK